MTKKTPAIGALKTEARPAAAPHPRRVAEFLGLELKRRAIFDPIVAPMVMMGPSAPADPPEPMVSHEAAHFLKPMERGM